MAAGQLDELAAQAGNDGLGPPRVHGPIVGATDVDEAHVGPGAQGRRLGIGTEGLWSKAGCGPCGHGRRTVVEEAVDGVLTLVDNAAKLIEAGVGTKIRRVQLRVLAQVLHLADAGDGDVGTEMDESGQRSPLGHQRRDQSGHRVPNEHDVAAGLSVDEIDNAVPVVVQCGADVSDREVDGEGGPTDVRQGRDQRLVAPCPVTAAGHENELSSTGSLHIYDNSSYERGRYGRRRGRPIVEVVGTTAPVSVVTGANSGIGRAVALHLAEKGHRVYGTVRDPARATKLVSMAADMGVQVDLVTMDVADDESVRTGMTGILAAAGRVDLLVNNAGIAANSVVEETSPHTLAEVMNVNLGGVVRCVKHVLPGMRERGDGCIVNISSVIGRFAAIAQAPYVASKFAVDGLSQELAVEVAPFGVRVVIVEPGVTKSAMFAKNTDAPNATGAYDAHYRRMFAFYAAGIPQATDPVEVAELVHEAWSSPKPSLRYVCSWGGRQIIDGRARMSDREWVALGAAASDDEYYARFEEAFGLDIRPGR